MNPVHGLNREKGLDLFLHTPGGDFATTESMVHYLRQTFGTNIRCFIPQLAMSGGTMMACACKEIYWICVPLILKTSVRLNGSANETLLRFRIQLENCDILNLILSAPSVTSASQVIAFQPRSVLPSKSDSGCCA